jgi:chromate transporter
MKKCSLLELFLVFIKVGAILLGGGYVILPILQSELCTKRDWLRVDDIVEYYALSQSLPGVIAINTTIFVGYKLRGKTGALISVIGLIFPAFWAIVCLSSILSKLTSNSIVQGIFWGVDISVLVLVISSVREMWSKAIKDRAGIVIFLVALAVMLSCDISPAFVIIGSIFCGIIYKSILRKKEGE